MPQTRNVRLDVILTIVLIILVIVAYLRFRSIEKFSPAKRAKTIHDGLNGLFTNSVQGFSEAKEQIPDLDAVEHSDARRLWNDGQFTVDNIYQSLVR